MPMYDYMCLDCGKESLIVLTLIEHGQGVPPCPSCGSKNRKQLFTDFIARAPRPI